MGHLKDQHNAYRKRACFVGLERLSYRKKHLISCLVNIQYYLHYFCLLDGLSFCDNIHYRCQNHGRTPSSAVILMAIALIHVLVQLILGWNEVY